MRYWKKSVLAALLAIFVAVGNTAPVYAEDMKQMEAEEVAESGNEKNLIGYVFVDETELALPGTQNIVVGFADETILPETAVLQYHSALTGELYESAADEMVAGAVLFSEEYAEDAIDDEYVLDGVCYTVNGQERRVLFTDEGIEKTGYTVGASDSVQTYEEDAVENTVSVYMLDKNGEMTVESGDIEEVEETMIEAAEQTGALSEVQKPDMSRAAKEKRLVVYLCAGHDTTHIGTKGYGLREEELNFKVRQYCKEELEKYGDVVVYTDRDFVECKYPGSSSGYCLNQRVVDAAETGADIFVDLHFNNAGNGGHSGSEVYYPNISYSEWIHMEGNVLADQILSQLNSLGLPNRGAKIRDCTTDYRDDAGNPADYYTSINASKAHGMTGIIVEHAYLDHEADAAKLKDEEFLKQLGIADARGIAAAYGLSEGEDTGKMLYWDVKPGDWYYDAAEYAFQNNIMTGLRTTQFGPSEKLARAQFATILHRMQGTPEAEYTERFPDVTMGQFYTAAVLWASKEGVNIITGYEDSGRFGPSDNITREQLVTMMYRYARFVKADTEAISELTGFADADKVNEFAVEAMKWAVGTGMIQGDNGLLNPGKNANRAECAAIIMRFMQYLEEHPAEPDEGEVPAEPDEGQTPAADEECIG